MICSEYFKDVYIVLIKVDFYHRFRPPKNTGVAPSVLLCLPV